VGDAGEDDLPEVSEELCERFSCKGELRGKLLPDFARFDPGQDREAGDTAGEIVRNPVRHLPGG
jgi:hypothetical protein